MLRQSFCLLAGLLACTSASALAQFTAAKITFRDNGPYSAADLERAAGLHAGDKISRDDIQAAAQKLMDTGRFDDVKIDSKGSPNALEIIFLLKPEASGHETPVGFEDFVWLTPDELHRTVQMAAPLFDGKVPEAGNELDAITAGLETALHAKGVSEQVTHEEVEPSNSQPERVIEFRALPRLRIGSIILSGVPSELTDAEYQRIHRLNGLAYDEGLDSGATARELLRPSENAGYLQAKLVGLQRVLNAAGQVDITATLETGPLFHVAALSFAGTPMISESAVMEHSKLHPGDVASRAQLLEAMQPIDEAYKKHGYMDVYVRPEQSLDTAAHTVSYTLVVVPGDVYRLRQVTPLGLSPAAQAEFQKAWRMQPGDIYNADYVSRFVTNNSSLPALKTYSGTFQAAADPNTHLVDLMIRFVPGPR